MDFGNKLNPMIENYKEEIDKERAKTFVASLEATNCYDNVGFYHQEVNPFFYDRTGMFWMWKKELCCFEIVDEIDLINDLEIKMKIEGKTIASQLKSKYIESFKRIGRRRIPEVPSQNWIQFKDMVYDLKTKEIFKATSKYFFTNSIPWSVGETDATPTMDKIFTQWVGEENIKTLYEVIAYSCLQDYPIHSLFCFMGSGRNGKSRFLALLNKFIGANNCCSSELDSLMDSRFESAKLFKKLVCFMGETNFGVMEKTSLLKKLTGQDSIGGEFKGKQPFDFVNYAKLCISSNSLPSSTDTSEGFYRRWMIVDFPNNFPEGVDILSTIPEIEYNNLARKITCLISELTNRGRFSNQGTIEERQKKFIMASNPLPIFIELFCDREIPSDKIKYSEFYLAYLKYLIVNKKRAVSRKEFKKVLDQEGLEVEKKTIDYESAFYIQGVKLKDDWEKMIKTIRTKKTTISTDFFTSEKPSEKPVFFVSIVSMYDSFIKEAKKSDKVFIPCHVCGLNPSTGNFSLKDGRGVCELCLANEDVLKNLFGRVINERETKEM